MTISRTMDANELTNTMKELAPSVAFNAEEWLAEKGNIALTDGEGSFNLLHHDGPGLYWGHTFYRVRGKEAVRLIKEATRHSFDNYPVEVLMGLTPIEKKGARWLSRQAGFKSYGVMDTSTGPCEMFILTRNELWAV